MTKISDIPKDDNGVRCEPGITYARYKGHPTCPFCGLADFTSKQQERPDGRHIMNCQHRPLSMLPCHKVEVGKDGAGKVIYDSHVKPGSFIGQAFMRKLKIPLRVMSMFHPRDDRGIVQLDDKGKPVELWWCYYMYSEVEVVDWVFTKDGWQPWFKVLKPSTLEKPKTIWKNLRWQTKE